MTSTMSARAINSSMKCCGMRDTEIRSSAARSAAQLGFYLRTDHGHVGLALRLRLDRGHGLAHVLDRGGAGGGNRLGDELIDFGVGKLCREIGLQERDLGILARHEVG